MRFDQSGRAGKRREEREEGEKKNVRLVSLERVRSEAQGDSRKADGVLEADSLAGEDSLRSKMGQSAFGRVCERDTRTLTSPPTLALYDQPRSLFSSSVGRCTFLRGHFSKSTFGA